MVGKRVCLVMLWQNPPRRDKPWNYIPLKFQRYTKHNLATGYLYVHVENVWGIPFPKRMKWKDCFLSELFQKQVSDYKWLQISWLQVDRWVTTIWLTTTKNAHDYKWPRSWPLATSLHWPTSWWLTKFYTDQQSCPQGDWLTTILTRSWWFTLIGQLADDWLSLHWPTDDWLSFINTDQQVDYNKCWWFFFFFWLTKLASSWQQIQYKWLDWLQIWLVE